MASYQKLLDAGRLLHRNSVCIVRQNWAAVSAVGAMCLHRTHEPAMRRLQAAGTPAKAGTSSRRTHRHSMTDGYGGDTVSRTWRVLGQHRITPLCNSGPGFQIQRRLFGNLASGSGFSEDGGEGSESGGDDAGGEPVGRGAYNGPPMTALTPMIVPEVFPNVPLIAVSRNPVFPRFIKILEVKPILVLFYCVQGTPNVCIVVHDVK